MAKVTSKVVRHAQHGLSHAQQHAQHSLAGLGRRGGGATAAQQEEEMWDDAPPDGSGWELDDRSP